MRAETHILWQYTGLRPQHLEALRDPQGAPPTMRWALRHGGLIDGEGRLTPAGEFALRRGQAIMAFRFIPPDPALEVEYLPGMWRRIGLPGAEAKLLVYVARFPETCLRFLRQEFGNRPLDALRERGLIETPPDFPWEAWSTPVWPSASGVDLLRSHSGGRP